ncbi:hypothetical protein F4776DRAFT_672115 [Hypoxylon sp. NC0597]|nr:hypothetical protein F4776DRAFT_672115 [Hypoxylon sp. NC0597]
MFTGPDFEVCCRCQLFHDHEEVDCFHAECYQSTNVFKITPQFRAAIRYSFQPPVHGSSAKYRNDRLHGVVVRDLKREPFPKQLPNEIWRIIARSAPMEFLMFSSHEQVRRIQTRDSFVEFSRDVYARFIMYGGLSYLKELSNSPSPDSKGEVLLFRGQPMRKVRKIYIAGDHLGVRGVKFVSVDSPDPPGPSPNIPGAWWRRIVYDNGIDSIRTATDGFKVRDIVVVGPKEASNVPLRGFDRLRWQVWEPPSVTIINIRSLNEIVHASCGVWPRMNSFDCNAPDLTGYSIAMTGERVISIHSHRQDTDLSFYQQLKPIRHPILWLYMPIQKGELITDIGRLYINGWRQSEIYVGLAFATNRGRTVFFGTNDLLVHRRTHCTRVYSPPTHPTRIYFNALDQETYEKGIGILACENPQHPVPMFIPGPAPRPIKPYLDPNLVYLYSSCSMFDVTSVTPCIDQSHPDKLVIGLLFQYKDGHQDCLGQIRLDWTTDPIEVDQTSKLRIGMTNPKIKVHPSRPFHESFMNVTRTVGLVVVSNSPKYFGYNSGHTWIDVPWYGTLEWWFSATSTVVRHHNMSA